MRTDLIEARKAKGLTQTQLADLIGRDQSDVSRYESGKRQVDVDCAPRLAQALGLSIVEVLYGPQRKAA
jgi:transcriptional regulator with XRE-family HTH domain